MDLLFDMFASFHGVMMSFAGFIASAIGLLIAGHGIYTRFKAQHVIGRVIGVYQGRGSNPTYRRIYEFKAPNGTIEKRPSSIASGNIPDASEAQKKVKLLYSENDTYITRHGNYLQVFIGAVFCIPGFIFLHQGIQSLEAGLPTLLIFILVFLFFGAKLLSFKQKAKINLSEIPQKFKELKEQSRERRNSERPSIKDQNDTKKESIYVRDMTPLTELKESDAYQFENMNKTNHHDIIAPIAMLAGVVLILASLFTGQDVYNVTTYGLKTTGEVVDMRSRRSTSDGKTTTTYYPIMAFTTEQGEKIRFESSTGSSHPSIRTGDSVEIYYLPQKPEETAMRDKGFFFNYLLSVILFVVGIFALFIGQDLWRKSE